MFIYFSSSIQIVEPISLRKNVANIKQWHVNIQSTVKIRRINRQTSLPLICHDWSLQKEQHSTYILDHGFIILITVVKRYWFLFLCFLTHFHVSRRTFSSMSVDLGSMVHFGREQRSSRPTWPRSFGGISTQTWTTVPPWWWSCQRVLPSTELLCHRLEERGGCYCLRTDPKALWNPWGNLGSTCTCSSTCLLHVQHVANM